MLVKCIIYIIIILCTIRTISFGVWCFRDKNILGGISVFFLAVCSALCLFVIH